MKKKFVIFVVLGFVLVASQLRSQDAISKIPPESLYYYYNLEAVVSVNFKSWLPSPDPLDFFWISNTEIVFKAYPVRQYITNLNTTSHSPSEGFQYIKLTIL